MAHPTNLGFSFQINLLFLINIVRIVLAKSQGPSDLSAHTEGAHIKKALRATIILFPLLGEPFAIFPSPL